MTEKQRQVKAERECATWNAAHPVGTTVRYWKGVKEGDPSGVGETHNEATVMCGTAVAWIHGCSGCVALSHVEVV